MSYNQENQFTFVGARNDLRMKRATHDERHIIIFLNKIFGLNLKVLRIMAK